MEIKIPSGQINNPNLRGRPPGSKNKNKNSDLVVLTGKKD